MKKFLLIVFGLILLILAAAVVLPIIYKDDIKAAIDSEIDKNVKAKVYYDVDHLNLTLFKNFPNITVGMGNFGVVGIDQFEGDTLMSMGSFEVVVDIMSVINGEKINVNSISLVEPNIYVIVLADGTANYDIAVASEEIETPAETDDSATAFNVGINKWEIVNGNLIYFDQSMNFYTSIMGLNHEGSGDFTQDLFDLTTHTAIDAWSLGYEGEEYLTNKRLAVDFTMAMDLPNSTYTFKQNRIALNDFGIGFDGTVAMPGDDINMDLTFTGQDISLVSLFSLIPGAYTEYLDGLDANATINFGGMVKGTYNDNTMPAINAKLKVDNGRITYAEYPIPIEQLTIDSELDVPSADLTTGSFNLNKFSMLVDGEKMEATLAFKNFEDYQWDFGMNGNVDLAKLMKLMPMDSMELEGKITAALQTKGKMSDLEAERYDQLPTNGSLGISDFKFSSPDLPQGFGIKKSEMTFDPSTIALKSFDATLGKSDMQMNGSLSNYLAYALNENEIIKGTLNFNSGTFDLNEWMTEEEVVEEDTTTLSVIEVPTNIDFVLASNIGQVLYDNMAIKDMKGNIIVRDGSVRMEGVNMNLLNGSVSMNGFYTTAGVDHPTFDFDLKVSKLSIPESFKTFSTIQTLAPMAEKMIGNFSTDFKIGGALGDDMMPLYDHLFGAGLVEIAEAAYKGDMKVLSAVSSVTKLGAVSNAANNDGQIKLKDVLMQAEIKNGRVHLKPFDLEVGGYKTTVSGSNGVDGSLDYVMKMDVPTGQLAGVANNLLASFTGGQSVVGEKIRLNLGVTGNYEDPKVKILSTENASGSSPKQAVKQSIRAEVDKQKAEAEAKIQQEIADQKAAAEEEAKKQLEKAKEEVKDAVGDELKENLGEGAEEAKDALKGLFKKKKKKGN
ncbi:MAG: AsmA-like C-terminal region-containing protein [Cyclobacteriaceae bacterium]